MAATKRARITCVNKPVRNSTTTRVSHIGNQGGKVESPRAIQQIKDRSWEYYVLEAGREVLIGVNGPEGRQFLQTYADGTWRNNLLALPECP